MTKLTTTILLVSVWLLLDPNAAHAQPTPRPWTLSLGAGVFYDNSLVIGSPVAIGQVGTALQANLGRTLIFTGRGSLRLDGNATEFLYVRDTGPSEFTYGAIVSGTYAFTRRLSWTVSGGVTSGFARDAELLTEQGVVIPNGVALTQRASTSLTYALDQRTNVGVTANVEAAQFDAFLFRDAATVVTNVNLSRQLTATQSVGMSAGYSRAFVDGRGGEIQSLMGTWQLNQGRATFTGGVGLQPYTLADESGYRFNPTYSAGWTMGFNENHSVTASYSHLVQYAFGLDQTNLTQGLSGSYQLSYGRVTVGLNGNYNRVADSLTDPITDISPNGSTLYLSLGYRVAPNLTISGGTSIYSSSPTTSTYRSTFSLSYVTSF